VQWNVHVWSSRHWPERASGFSLLDAVLQGSQWTRGAIIYVSERSVNKNPFLSNEKNKEKQRNMDYILYTINNKDSVSHKMVSKTHFHGFKWISTMMTRVIPETDL
jgi:hypothetical protein